MKQCRGRRLLPLGPISGFLGQNGAGKAPLAEHCFLSAFEHCIRSTTVFREWAESWAKRATIVTAIRIVFDSQPPANAQVGSASHEAASGMEALLAGVLNLAPFDRFVYVMSVLERIPNKECGLLLDCSLRDL